MSHTLLHDPQMNTVVFEGRNQAYGAYELRLRYEERMMRGLIFGVALFVTLVLIPFMHSKLKREEMITIPESSMEVFLEDFIPEKKPKPAEIKPTAAVKPPASQIKFVPPVVVKESDPVKEESLPSQDSLKNINIGTTDVKPGDSPSEPGPVDLPVTPDPTPAPAPEPGPMQSFAVQELPEFPNGMSALYAFISREVRYASTARENGISGTVHVEFVVGKTGRVEEAKILRGIGGGLDQEVLRVVNIMPTWKPGKHNGRAVPVVMRLPIKFELLR